VACVDATTGSVLADEAFLKHPGIGVIGAIGHHLYAYGEIPNARGTRIVEVAAPSVCWS
jgi:hypothetical protein